MTTEPICNYKPTQGIWKDQPCLLPPEHEGIHIYDPDKIPKSSAEPASEHFTDEEIANAISEEEIRKRSEKLDEAQSIWERAYERATPMIPCPECNTRGAVIGGTLGDACPTCHGKRVIPDESVDVEFEMPTMELEGKKVPLFPVLRGALSAYGDALQWRKNGLPPRLTASTLTRSEQRQKADIEAKMRLPPASSVPTMEQIEQLLSAGREQHKALGSGESPGLLRRTWNRLRGKDGEPLELPPAQPLEKSGFETEGGIEETATDAELDQMEREKGIR